MKILVVSFLRNMVTPCFPTLCHNIANNSYSCDYTHIPRGKVVRQLHYERILPTVGERSAATLRIVWWIKPWMSWAKCRYCHYRHEWFASGDCHAG